MTGWERFRSAEDTRRTWQRVPVRLTMRCRRLGFGGVDEEGEAVDLSPGGVRLRAPDRLGTGDVVLCSVVVAGSEVDLKGLVVHTSGRRDGFCDVHVAWTNLSDAARDGLDHLLELQESVKPSGDSEAGAQAEGKRS